MDLSVFQSYATYVGFTEADGDLLRGAKDALAPYFPSVVDAFYDAIRGDSAARALFKDDAQIDRQKTALHAWLEEVFQGPYDDAYVARHARIGRVHVRLGVSQRFVSLATNVVRTRLHESVTRLGIDDSARRVLHQAIDRILDLELTVMLETYQDDYVSRMRAAERLATLGELAGSIGHELRNPLAVIETSSHILARRCGEDERALRHIDRIRQQTAIAGEIISDLLDLARNRPPNRHSLPLKPLVADALDALRRKADVDIAVEVSEDVVVFADGGQLRQVVRNLVQNAADAASEGGGHVWVRAQEGDDGVSIVVEDDGRGIAQQAKDRLFEPLFTTKVTGIGLGLALCRRVVQGHEGTISAEDRPGGGAIFRIRLPHPPKSA